MSYPNIPHSDPAAPSSEPAKPSLIHRILYRRQIGPAFWNIASFISLGVNLILLAVLVLLARQLFSIKRLVSDQLVNGLYTSFAQMDQSHIVTTILVSDTIQVNDSIPVVFDLPLSQETEVKLTKNTPVNNTTIFLNGQAVPVDLVLRKGTRLNIKLDMVIPVKQRVPVVLNVPVQMHVPVDIALNQTDLHRPFTGLQQVVTPYHDLLSGLPAGWSEIPLCRSASSWLCKWLFQTQ